MKTSAKKSGSINDGRQANQALLFSGRGGLLFLFIALFFIFDYLDVTAGTSARPTTHPAAHSTEQRIEQDSALVDPPEDQPESRQGNLEETPQENLQEDLQERPLSPTTPQIMEVDTTLYPSVNISVLSTGLPMDMLRLPIQIVEHTADGERVSTTPQSYPDYVGAKRLIVINQDQFDKLGVNGKSHRINFESMMREIYDHPAVFTNDDWLAAYAVARPIGATQIAPWSQDKADYFIALVTHQFENPNRPTDQNQPAADDQPTLLSDPNGVKIAQDQDSQPTPILSDLRDVFQRFEMLPPDSRAVKSVVIFSDSVQPILTSGRSSIEGLIRYATQQQIYVHGVHMARAGNRNDSRTDMALKTLVEETGGVYVYYQAESDLFPLWTRLNEEKQRTRLIYQPNSGAEISNTKTGGTGTGRAIDNEASNNETINALQVRVTLPDGSFAESHIYPVDFSVAAALSQNNRAGTEDASGNETAGPTTGLADAPSSRAPLANASSATVNSTDSSTAGTSSDATSGDTTSAPWSSTFSVSALLTQARSTLGLPENILSGELMSVPRGTLLVLWAICLGLLFFLVFPEIAKGWRFLRSGSGQSQQKALSGREQLAIGTSQSMLLPNHASITMNGLPGAAATLEANGLNGSVNNLVNGTHDSAPGYTHAQNGHAANGHANNGHPVGDDAAFWAVENDETNVHDAVQKQELGRLVRITYDSSLPQEVPIYQPNHSDLDEVCIYIGRTRQQNTVVIPDKKKRVSREHAVLILEKGLLYLRDNKSGAGTFLNGEQLEAGERKLLRDRDRIGLGDVEYQIQLQSEEATVINVQEDVQQEVQQEVHSHKREEVKEIVEE